MSITITASQAKEIAMMSDTWINIQSDKLSGAIRDSAARGKHYVIPADVFPGDQFWQVTPDELPKTTPAQDKLIAQLTAAGFKSDFIYMVSAVDDLMPDFNKPKTSDRQSKWRVSW
jgi:hypothetical protein